MKIEFRNIDINEKFFNPTLRIGVKWEYTQGMEALMNAFGNLIYEGKIIGKLELENENNLSFAIYALDETQNKNSYTIDLFFQCVLNREVIRYINDTRKKARNGDVNLSVDIKLLYLESRTFITNYKSQTSANIKLLSTHSGNPYLEIGNASASCPTPIKASDWVNDFAPKLGLGEFEIVEIPKLKNNELTKKFEKSLAALEDSKKLLHSLNLGSAMTSLRNSLSEFNNILISLGYNNTEEKNKKIAEYSQIFKDNNNIAILAQSLQENLFGASSRGNESSAPHTGLAIEGYEIESMISMTYSLYKMVFEKLRAKEELKGD